MYQSKQEYFDILPAKHIASASYHNESSKKYSWMNLKVILKSPEKIKVVSGPLTEVFSKYNICKEI